MHKKAAFPPLHRRSAFLKLEGEENENIFHLDHRYALLPESTEDYLDVLSAVNDMLTQSKVWWILEAWPVKIRVLAKDGDGWEKRVRLNMGRYRAIRETAPRMHWTVERLQQEGLYEVKGRVERKCRWNVVV
jgi:hypothetical protein